MKKAIFSFLAISITWLSMAQSKENTIKVGLVLSGGGAKGLAHIGAIKVIEKAGVKIDYIGGTSMGAIVGALYASGYSSAELDSIFRRIDFNELIKDNLPRSAKTFYEKEDSERYALTLPFSKFKISTPSAYSGGQNIYNELVRLLYHVKDVKNFNDLPIPFVCIATDIETGKEVVLNKGYLPEAVMASGTLPSLFEPAILEGKVLIDGGIVNNYPIYKVKAMGADVIIGVDVQHNLSDRESLKSATEILLQINNFKTAADMVEKSKQTTIYIKPDIEKYSILDFDKGDAIIKAGEVAAQEKHIVLEELSIDQKYTKNTIESIKAKDEIIVNRLVIEGESQNYSRGYVKGKLRFRLGEKITFEKLQQGISNLSATGNFKSIRYQLLSNGIGEDLILKLKENPTRTFIRLGAHYDDLYKSAALINLTSKNIFLGDDVASFDLILGDNLRYNFEYYLDKGSYWSFGINSRFNDFQEEVNIEVVSSNFEVPNVGSVNAINFGVTDITNQVYLQTFWKEEIALTLGLEHKYIKYSTRTLAQLIDETDLLISENNSGRTLFEKSNYYSAYGQLTFDTYNDKYFPTKGVYFDGDIHFYAFSSDFNENFKEFSVVKGKAGFAFPVVDKLSLNIGAEIGFKLGTSNVTTFDFVLGGYGTDLINNFVPFLGYDFLSIPGNSYLKADARLDYEFAPKNHFMFSANFANADDDIFRTSEWFSEPTFSGYAIGYGFESFIGPAQVLYSWSPEINQETLFFSIGYWF